MGQSRLSRDRPTLREGVKRSNAGETEPRPGTMTADPPERMAELEAENRGLRQELDDLKRATAGVRQSVDLFRSLVENAPNTIMTVDRDGLIQFMNRTDFPEYSVEDILGTSIFNYVDPAYHEQYQGELEQVFRTGEPDDLETEVSSPHGEVRWFRILCAPVKREGRVVAVSLTSFDITR